MLEPRPYQSEAVGDGLDFLLSKNKGNGIIYLPTGAGKSLIAALLALHFADHKNGGPVVILQPSKEILEQNAQKFRDYGYEPAILSTSAGGSQIGDITLATIGTIWRVPELFEDFACAIPDECHLINAKAGMYNAFRKALPHMRWLGLTASPWRMASNSNGTELRFITRTVPRIFQHVVHYTQIQHLVENGWWAKLDYKLVRGFDRSKIKINSTGAEYDEKALQMHLFETDFRGRILEVVQRAFAAGRRNMMVFTPSVADADYIAKQMGDGFASVSTDTPPKKRAKIVEGFKSGRIRGVANVGVFIHGLDHPELECVIDSQPGLSLSRYYQKCGRGVRPHPNKESCWIVDMVDSHGLFGRIDDLRLYCKGEDKWFIAGRPGGHDKPEKQLTNVYLQGDAGMKRCPRCKSTDIFFMRHAVTGASATLSRPKPGEVKPNIVIRKNHQNKTVYAIVSPSDPDYHLAEFVNHAAICSRRPQ